MTLWLGLIFGSILCALGVIGLVKVPKDSDWRLAFLGLVAFGAAFAGIAIAYLFRLHR